MVLRSTACPSRALGWKIIAHFRWSLTLAAIAAASLIACSKSFHVVIGKEYPVQTRGYVCADEANLLRAKHAYDQTHQFIAQPNCVGIGFGDTVRISGTKDHLLMVDISDGQYRGIATTGYTGFTALDYLKPQG